MSKNKSKWIERKEHVKQLLKRFCELYDYPEIAAKVRV